MTTASNGFYDLPFGVLTKCFVPRNIRYYGASLPSDIVFSLVIPIDQYSWDDLKLNSSVFYKYPESWFIKLDGMVVKQMEINPIKASQNYWALKERCQLLLNREGFKTNFQLIQSTFTSLQMAGKTGTIMWSDVEHYVNKTYKEINKRLKERAKRAKRRVDHYTEIINNINNSLAELAKV